MQQAEKIGLDGFLIKPVSSSVMFDTIIQAFGKELPRQLKADAIKRIDSIGSENIAGANVLLVEDNEINQQVADEILSGAGLKVTIAGNGQEALDLVQANDFDVVLMDVQMPVMDGYTATREIRKWEGGARNPSRSPIPIIAMTAHAMTGDHEKSIAAGMNDHITKPIDPVQLFGTLVKWISHREETPKKIEDSTTSTSAQVIKPSQPEQTLPDSLPEFDLDEGLKRLMGNRDLYRMLLVDFASQYAPAADKIRTALDTGDFEQAHQLVHAIKGVAGNLAAKELHQHSAALEKLVKNANAANPPPAEDLKRSYEAFRETLNWATDAAASLMVSETVPAIPVETTLGPLPPDLAREATTRLRQATEIGDVSELTAICSELVAKSETFAPYAIEVTRLAKEFDFDSIFKLIDKMNS